LQDNGVYNRLRTLLTVPIKIAAFSAALRRRHVSST
jgi:hypothetical protein